MVRKASRLQPNAKSLEEVLLQRAVDGTAASEQRAQQHSSVTAPEANARRLNTTRATAAATAGPASSGVGRRNANLSHAAPLVSSRSSSSDTAPAPRSAPVGVATMECMTQIAGEVASLDKRVRSLAYTSSNSSSSARGGVRRSTPNTGVEDAQRTHHQQEIERLVQQSMNDVYAAGKARRAAAVASAAASTVHPSAGAHITHAVRELRSTVRRLDRVFYEVASGDKQRQIAATKIAMLCRAFITRRRFLKFYGALGAWRARKCATLLACVEQFSAREEFINRQVVAMHIERTNTLLRKVLAELRDVVLMNLPLRMRRIEETERRFQAKQRTLIKSVFAPWKSSSLGPRSRKKASADAKKRHLEARHRLESLGRFEVVTTEMVHEEFLKENIRTIRGKHQEHVLRMYFRLMYSVELLPAKLKLQRAIAHDRKKCLLKIWGVWLQLFRAAQVDKAIARVNERRTLSRFDKHHNLRKIDAHYRHTNLRKHLRAWAFYGQRIRRVRRLFEDTTKENLVRLLRKWHIRAEYQHALRANVVEEWNAYSRRIFQTPFRCWYVFASHKKSSRVAKETICLAYERRQRRHIKYGFFRLWKHQVLFGNVESVLSKMHLLRSLEDQKRMCLGLEANARLYQENIAALQASIAQMETKLAEKQQELVEMHDATQATRFGIHTAEQNIARVQGMLEAVRNIHPGTVDRIEKMYKDNPLLTRDLKDVVGLHESKRKELMEKIDLDETELEVHNASSSLSAVAGGSQDDQLLLHRVKWMLSRLDLQQMRASGEDGGVPAGSTSTLGAAAVSMDTMNQLCALFEFIRNGDASVLTPENSPIMIGESSASEAAAASTSEGCKPENSIFVRRHDLFERSASWHMFLQALTTKFVPDRMLSVRERLMKRAARMDNEVAEIKANPHIYNLYSGAAQVKTKKSALTEEP